MLYEWSSLRAIAPGMEPFENWNVSSNGISPTSFPRIKMLHSWITPHWDISKNGETLSPQKPFFTVSVVRLPCAAKGALSRSGECTSTARVLTLQIWRLFASKSPSGNRWSNLQFRRFWGTVGHICGRLCQKTYRITCGVLHSATHPGNETNSALTMDIPVLKPISMPPGAGMFVSHTRAK